MTKEKTFAMEQGSRLRKAKNILIFWCLFVGIGAVWGASCMLIKPDGSLLQMDGMLPYFQVLPLADVLFQDFIFSGFALLIVNGLTNLTAAVFLLAKRRVGLTLGALFGITLMMWILIQFFTFPMNPLSISYFIFGLCQFATGYACLVFDKQENFDFDKTSYKHVGEKHDEIVIYFSRLQRTAKVAYEYADANGCEIYELKSKEMTAGTLGFWWCGRFGMHQWGMPLEEVKVDWNKYSKVTICTPVWVFRIAAPTREFIRTYKDAIGGGKKKLGYIAVSFNPSLPSKVFGEMDETLGAKAEMRVHYTGSLGKIKFRK